MTQAKKVTRNAGEGRPVLKGVKHYEDGSVAVTDSHRLYLLKDAGHTASDTLIDPINQEEINGNYPDIFRLIPEISNQTVTVDVKELYKGVDIIYSVAKTFEKDPPLRWKGSQLDYEPIYEKGILTANYELPFKLPVDYEVNGNARYWHEALQLFRALGYKEFTLSFNGALRPFVLESLDNKLTVLVLPIRRF